MKKKSILKQLFERDTPAPIMSRDAAIQAVAADLRANPNSVALVSSHEDRDAILNTLLTGEFVVTQDSMGTLASDLCGLLRERVRVVIESSATTAPFQDMDPVDVAEAFSKPAV